MGRLRVLHCVVATTIRQYGPHPTSDLLGVDHYITVPADTEFPRTFGKLELFVRFFSARLRPTRLRIDVVYRGRTGSDRRVVFQRRFDLTDSQPGFMVFDRGFKMTSVVLPGEGDYVVTLRRRSRRSWRAASWSVLAAEYFNVVRAS